MMVCIWREVYLSAWWVLNSVVGFEGREALSDLFCLYYYYYLFVLVIRKSRNKQRKDKNRNRNIINHIYTMQDIYFQQAHLTVRFFIRH